jgi:predicted ATPase/DNA-binding winged helix-turn-helix (wHTH) protein
MGPVGRITPAENCPDWQGRGFRQPRDGTKLIERESEIFFGPYKLVVAERQILHADEPVHLSARALDLLTILIERAGRVVSKAELMAHVWPDVTVDEASLRFHVVALRRALKDGQDGARYVATIPGRGYCFVAAVHRNGAAGALPRADSASENISNLPPAATRIVGRDHSIQELSSLVLAERCVTILGPGGIGKTTVAVLAGHALSNNFEGAVRFIDLSPLREPPLVASALASMLGILVQSSDPIPSLVAFLKQKRMLIILDSCEHVIEAAAALAETLYRQAPQVHLLATSREALRAEREHVYQLPPLDSPPEQGGLTAREALGFSAVQLFVQRVVNSGMRFELDDSDAPTVAEVCRKLDGIALAIELAAGRVKAYGLQETARLLDGQFKLLWQGRRTALPRHQTLGATIDWSYALLGEFERVVLDRLSVFVGLFTLDAACSVVIDREINQEFAVNIIAALVEKSLVTADNSRAVTRYRLMDATRSYATKKLSDRGQSDETAFRHATYMQRLLRQMDVSYRDLMEVEGVTLHREYLGNARAALDWCFGFPGNPAVGVGVAAASSRLFFQLCLLTECREWSERAIGAIEQSEQGAEREMELQAALGQSMMFTKGNSEAVRKALMRSLELAEVLGRLDYQLQILGGLHLFHERIGDFSGALTFAERGESIAAQSGDPTNIAATHSFLGVAHHLLGNQRKSHEHLEAALRCPGARVQANIFGFDYRIRASITLARCLWVRGRSDEALNVALQTVEEASRLMHPITICFALIWAVSVLLWRGDYEMAEDKIAAFIAHAERHSLGPYYAVGRAIRAELAIRNGDASAGLTVLRDCLSATHNDRYELMTAEFTCAIAEGFMMTKQPEEALKRVNEAIDPTKRNGDTFMMPELLRIKGEILSSLFSHTRVAAEECFLQSLALSRSQSALSWELRTAISFARFQRREGRNIEAYELLAGVYHQFNEGTDTADLRSARCLLDELHQNRA